MIRQGFAGIAPATLILGWLVSRYSNLIEEDSVLITVEIANDEITQALGKLSNLAAINHSILDQIGEFLLDTTKQRFATSTAPDGTPWAPNSQVTILRYLGLYKGSNSKKTGKLTKPGAGRASGKRPLFGETGMLASQIFKGFDSSGALLIGSTREYAAVQQFGAKKHQFKGKAPWGDIPARPFLGISDKDESTILDIISLSLTDYLKP